MAFEGGFYRLRTGCPWRDLPSVDGGHHTIYRGGRSTKIHAASVSEPQGLEIILPGGQEGDALVGEEWLGEGLAYEEREAVRWRPGV